MLRLAIAGSLQATGQRGAMLSTAPMPGALPCCWRWPLAVHPLLPGVGAALALRRRKAGADWACAVRHSLHVRWAGARACRAPVFVANHASYIDVFLVLAALPYPVRFVAKQELPAAPLAGLAAATPGWLFVERFDARQGVADCAALRRFLRPARCFFSPRVHSRPGRLRAFRLGAFQLAIAKWPGVIPVALAGTRDGPARRDLAAAPRRVRIVFSEGIVPRARTGQRLRLRDAARAVILRHCGEPTSMARGVRRSLR
jgi:1-acyl-sn-glycerol-3-phosphate acyltransferase